ncbi:MAG: hypothetical protein ACXWUZ_03770 [Allosphingosinicella sp.]
MGTPEDNQLAGFQKSWAVAAAWIAWLTATLGSSLTFDIHFALGSDLGIKVQAFFQILCTVIFLIAWKRIRRFPLSILIGLAVVALSLFLTYLLLREQWTCVYPGAGRLTKGGEMISSAHDFLRDRKLLSADCDIQMSMFPKANGTLIWPFWDLIARFLSMFLAYALAWLVSAMLIVGALNEWNSRSEA